VTHIAWDGVVHGGIALVADASLHGELSAEVARDVQAIDAAKLVRGFPSWNAYSSGGWQKILARYGEAGDTMPALFARRKGADCIVVTQDTWRRGLQQVCDARRGRWHQAYASGRALPKPRIDMKETKAFVAALQEAFGVGERAPAPVDWKDDGGPGFAQSTRWRYPSGLVVEHDHTVDPPVPMESADHFDELRIYGLPGDVRLSLATENWFYDVIEIDAPHAGLDAAVAIVTKVVT
jgi:hypothetical protein